MMKNNKTMKIIIISVAIVLVISIIAVLAIVLIPKNSDNQNNNNQVSEETNTVDENVAQDENTVDQENEDTQEVEYVETSDGSKIPLPKGFTYVEGTVSTGAVIKDEKGNEFVWVPTDNIVFARRTFENPNTNTSDEENTTNIGSTNEVEVAEANFSESAESNAEYMDSVNKYRGFYIGRYEASQDAEDENKASTVSGAVPLTEIVYDRMREIAQNTYADSSSVKSDITSSFVWDTLCKWLENSGYDIYNSTSYGNYANNIEGTKSKAVTGSNSKWVTNNIYDLAGNVWEISTEEWGDIYEKNHSGRGGGFHNDGINYPISCRVAEYDGAYTYIGFRLVLYLK